VSDPTPERIAIALGEFEQVVIEENDQRVMISRFLDGHPLEALYKRAQINLDQYSAGWQHYADWYAAGLAPRGVIDFSRDPVDGTPCHEPNLHRMAAQTRYHKAVKALPSVLLNVITSIVLNEERVREFAMRTYALVYRDPEKRVTATMTHLRLALDALCEHYGMRRISKTRPSSMLRPDAKPTVRTEFHNAP
jgi:hypothetical protein